MSFNKRILPPVEDLVKIMADSKDDKEFIDRAVGKSDCIMGSQESMEMVRYIQERILKAEGL
jgi:hypothetical protein